MGMDNESGDDPARFAALKAAFLDACEAEPEARQRLLDRLRDEDATLADELIDLLGNLDVADLAAPEADLRVGPFRVVRKIGEGGMGEVFLAVRDEADFIQRVALKWVRRTALSNELHRRFLRERQALARLQHPGIARLIDGGIDADERAWLAMEYVEGKPLLAFARGLPIPERVALLRRICASVAYAHRNLIVHRDIKPGNVLVTADGEPRLLDFGIAQMLDDTPAEATRTGQFALTPRYAAPEQLLGERTTTATDVHALGLLLYELLADTLPFTDDGAGRGVLTQPPRPFATTLRARRDELGGELWRRITGDLDRVARKALEKAPSERYADVAAFDADLSDWLERRPLRSGIGGARAQTRYVLHRYRWPLASAVAVVLALGVGALVALDQARDARTQSRIAQSHLAVLLDVLGSANPEHYAGREPGAGRFLADAAQRLARDASTDPELLRRASTEIGHALVNLGRLLDAERVLLIALDAAARDATAGSDNRLAILGLLIHAQDRPEAQARLADTAARIERLAHATDASAAAAIGALARAAGVLSSAGEGGTSRRLFAQVQQILAATPDLPVTVMENVQRQRGWAALRHMDLDTAAEALTASAALSRHHPDLFPTLRHAEAERLLAQLALLRGNATAALAHLARAQDAYAAEYPPAHPEYASFQTLQAWARLDKGDTEAAGAALEQALPTLLSHRDDYARDLVLAHALRAELAAGAGQCDAAATDLTKARALLEGLPIPLPRDHAILAARTARVVRACPAGSL